jgi:hypothetical protein
MLDRDLMPEGTRIIYIKKRRKASNMPDHHVSGWASAERILHVIHGLRFA